MRKTLENRDILGMEPKRTAPARSHSGCSSIEATRIRFFLLLAGLTTIISGWFYVQPVPILGKSLYSNVTNGYTEKAQSEPTKKSLAANLRSLSTAIRSDPSAAENYLSRASIYSQLGQFPKALHDLGRYIELRPSDAAGYLKRGEIHSLNHDYESALADYNAAVKLAPKSTRAYVGRGLVRAALEQYDNAAKDYQWALTIDPDNSEILSNMGIACMMAGRSLEAVSYFERALKREKDLQWRAKIEKWIDELVKAPEYRGKANAGPIRTPSDRKAPLW